MTTLLTSLLSLTVSLLGLVILIKSDPKRHRRAENKIVLSDTVRVRMAWCCLLPGCGLLLGGYYTSFLVWMGGITILGWGLALLPKKIA